MNKLKFLFRLLLIILITVIILQLFSNKVSNIYNEAFMQNLKIASISKNSDPIINDQPSNEYFQLYEMYTALDKENWNLVQNYSNKYNEYKKIEKIFNIIRNILLFFLAVNIILLAILKPKNIVEK